VFMSEKAIVIIIFMYSTSFSLLAAQYVLGDVFGTTLTSPITGQPLKSNLIGGNGTTGIISISTINTQQNNITSITRTNTVTNPIGTAAGQAWELLQILTGTYIFNVLALLGVPGIFVSGLVVLYVILLARAIIAYIRGITQDTLYAKLFQHNPYNNTVLCFGHSMKNILGTAIVKYSKFESYQVGDVISFIGKNNVKYCHRIIQINNETFTAQGDNLSKSQDYEIDVPIRNIEGKIFWSYPRWIMTREECYHE
jgi:hypothetical protein